MSKLCMGNAYKGCGDVPRTGLSYYAKVLNLKKFLPNRFNVGDSNIYIT